MAKSSANTQSSESTIDSDKAEKWKALDAACLQINKQFGAGSLMKLGEHTNTAGINVIPSGGLRATIYSEMPLAIVTPNTPRLLLRIMLKIILI